MPVPFCASESRIRSFLDAINTGRPIDNGRPWSLLDLLTLAGSVQCAILSHAPLGRDGERVNMGGLHSEREEAVVETHEREVIQATRFLSTCAFGVLGGHFAGRFGTEAVGIMMVDESGTGHVQMGQRPDEVQP